MNITSSMYIKCRCGHSFKSDDLKVNRIFVITGPRIDQMQFTVDYKCPKCGKETHATGYFS